jgi:arylsulfatase A-like enzyme
LNGGLFTIYQTLSTRVRFILAALVLAATPFGFSQAPGTALEDRPPNIVVIVGDNLGQDWIGSYGSDEAHTPNIDRLAATGFLFENCYATPLCSTARVMLMTGRYPFRTGWTTHHDAASYSGGNLDSVREITFPRLLREAGYRTALSGKWMISNLQDEPDALHKHGFDEHCVWPMAVAGDPRRKSDFWDMYIERDGVPVEAEGRFCDDIFTDYIIDFMRENRDRPFLAYLATRLAHAPPVKTPHSMENLPAREQFSAMVTYFDHLVGRIDRAVDELGLRENTVIIFVTDNGTNQSLIGSRNGAVYKGGVGWLLENGINVPLIVRMPQPVPGGRVVSELADFTDILPTVVELAGAKLPDNHVIDGRSFAWILRGDSEGPRREWIHTQNADMRVVRDYRFKLYSAGNLYDMLADYGETRNLAGSADPEVVAARRKLQAVLDSFPPDAPLGFLPRSSDAEARRRGGGRSLLPQP